MLSLIGAPCWTLKRNIVCVQSCPTLCDPIDCSLPGYSVHGIFPGKNTEWVAISFSRGTPPFRGLNPCLLCLLHWQVDSLLFSSVQSNHSVMSDSLWTCGLQHARPSCPSPIPGVYSNSCPSSQRCHTTISTFVIPFSSHCLSFPASQSFPMRQLFASGGQSIGVSASASVLPMNFQDWFPLGLTDWISLLSKGLSRVFFNSKVQKHQLFGSQPSLWPNSHIPTRLLEKPQLWLDGPWLAK